MVMLEVRKFKSYFSYIFLPEKKVRIKKHTILFWHEFPDSQMLTLSIKLMHLLLFFPNVNKASFNL